MSSEQETPVADTYETAKVILIVGDDEGIGTFLVQAIAQEMPYHPVWVKDGFAGLKLIHDLKPNLLLLDYQLPRMSGIEFYDQVRAIPGLEAIPAILMTAFSGMPRSQIDRRKLVGIGKPFELSEMLATIEQLLAQGE